MVKEGKMLLTTIPSKLCVVDVEANFDYGLQYYHEKYKLESMAFYIVRDQEVVDTLYTEDMEEAGGILLQAQEQGYMFLVWNLTYEYGVFLTQFGIDIKESVIDAMLVYKDATERKSRYSKKPWGLSLANAAWEMCDVKDYKNKHLQPLIDNGVAKNMKDAHAHVAELPSELLEAYNLDDVKYTWEVFYKSCERLQHVGYDWTRLHPLYVADCVRNVNAFIRGIKIDRDMLYKGYKSLERQQQELSDQFMLKYEEAINTACEKIKSYKEDKSYYDRKAKAKNPDKIKFIPVEPIVFNINSTDHKAYLADALGLEARFFTDAGSPSFNRKHLHQWGELGKDLEKFSKISRPIMECEKVLALSEDTGRLHTLVRPAMTITGRSTN